MRLPLPAYPPPPPRPGTQSLPVRSVAGCPSWAEPEGWAQAVAEVEAYCGMVSEPVAPQPVQAGPPQPGPLEVMGGPSLRLAHTNHPTPLRGLVIYADHTRFGHLVGCRVVGSHNRIKRAEACVIQGDHNRLTAERCRVSGDHNRVKHSGRTTVEGHHNRTRRR